MTRIFAWTHRSLHRVCSDCLTRPGGESEHVAMNGEAMITAGMIAEEVLRERAITLECLPVEVIKTEDGMIEAATEMMIAVATMTTGPRPG